MYNLKTDKRHSMNGSTTFEGMRSSKFVQE
uniref:Uncharacterized protein n=1 Tax=Anguilla anguilla TaxID=7936 RepID=A0A0E9VVR3_ANGAN